MKIRVGILFIGTLIQVGLLFMFIRPLYRNVALPLPLLNVYGVRYTDSILVLAYGYFYFGCITFFHMGAMRRFLDGYGILLLSRGKEYSYFIVKQFAQIVVSVCIIYGMEVAMSIVMNRIFNLGVAVRFSSVEFISATLWIVTVSILVWMQMMLELFMPETVAVLIINIYGIISIIIGTHVLAGGSLWKYLCFLNFALYARIQESGVQWTGILLSLAGHAAAIALLSYHQIQRRDYL